MRSRSRLLRPIASGVLFATLAAGVLSCSEANHARSGGGESGEDEALAAELANQPGGVSYDRLDELAALGPESARLLALMTTSEHPGLGQGARAALWKIGPGAVPELRAALAPGNSPGMRRGAAIALGVLGADAAGAAPGMIRLMKEAAEAGDQRLIEEVARALEEVGPDALEPLGEAYGDYPALRPRIVLIVTRFGLPSVPTLRAWQAEDLPGVSDRNRNDLRLLEWRLLERMSRIGEERELLAGGSEIPYETTEEPLTGEESRELGVEGRSPQDAAPVLAARLHSDDPFVRRRAARALALTGESARAGLGGLVKGVSSNDIHMRWACAEALAAIGAEAAPAVEPLRAMLEEANLESRRRGAHALGRIGESARPAIPRLEELLADAQPRYGDPHSPWPVQCEAARALATIAPDAAPSPLAGALADPDWRVGMAAAEGLALCGPGASIVLEESLANESPRVRRGAALAFLMSGETAWFAREAIEKTASEDSDAVARWAAAETLERLGREL